MVGLARSTRTAWPFGLLGMLALVAIAEWTIARGSRFKTDKAASWAYAAHEVRRQSKHAEVVFLGDSMVKFGLLPRIVESHTGWRAFNLAVFDGPPLASLTIFEQLLTQGGRPRAIVVNFMPHQLERALLDPKHANVWFQLMSLPKAWDHARRLGAYELLLGQPLVSNWPSVAIREEWRASLLASFEGRQRSTEGMIRVYQHNWMANLGAHVLTARDTPGTFEKTNDELFSARWHARPMNLAVVRRFLDLARQHAVQVHWLISPMHPDAQARLEEIGVLPRYLALLNEIICAHPELVVLDGRGLGLGANDFVDAVHLDREGAVVLSQACAEALRASTPASRWIALRTVSREQPNVPIEDIGESRLAVRDNHPPRRR
jgi:hypothetical protein